MLSVTRWARAVSLAMVGVVQLLGGGAPAHAILAAVSRNPDGTFQVHPTNGFPLWYRDTTGVVLRQCNFGVPGDPVGFVQDPHCIPAGVAARPLPNLPFHYAFYALAETELAGGSVADFRYIAGLEAAFATGDPAPGQQMVFTRIGMFANVTEPGTYTVTHPFGSETIDIVDIDPESPEIKFTRDIGLAPLGFHEALVNGEIGPFLTCVGPAPPAGYLGDFNVPCTVTGSPILWNSLRITGPATDISTDKFVVSGKLERPPVLAEIGPQSVPEGSLLSFTLLATDPDPGDTLTLGATGLPSGAVFDAGSGTFAWTPGYSQAGSYEVSFTVSDGIFADSETITISVASPVGPIFADDFTDGASALDWAKVSGAWSSGGGVYTAGSVKKNNLTRVSPLDPASSPLAAGVVQARVKLTSTAARSGPNALLVFAYQDPTRYRWVKITPSDVHIGQTGTIGATTAGTKRRRVMRQPVGRFGLYTARIFPDGCVYLSKGTSRTPALSYCFQDGGLPSVVPGGVGLASSKARTIFDNVNVWEDSALTP